MDVLYQLSYLGLMHPCILAEFFHSFNFVMSVDIQILLTSLSIDEQPDDDRQVEYDHECTGEEKMLVLMHHGVHGPEDV